MTDEPRIPYDQMAEALQQMAWEKLMWIGEFADGPKRRPEWEVGLKRRQVEILNQAIRDYAKAAGRANDDASQK